MKCKKLRPEFYENLESKWYSKLSKSGFEDIEKTNHPNRPLKTWHNLKFKDKDIQLRLATESYYDAAKDLLLSYSFKNETHKRIWELHCQGFSKRKIERQICHLKETYKRESIGLIIKKIAGNIKK